ARRAKQSEQRIDSQNRNCANSNRAKQSEQRIDSQNRNCANSNREKPRAPLDNAGSSTRGSWALGQHVQATAIAATRAPSTLRRKLIPTQATPSPPCTTTKTCTFCLTPKTWALMLLHKSVHKRSHEMKVGYARVSTTEQDLSAQLAALKKAGCQRIYSEKRSGANGNRDALQRMLKELQAGDIVVVPRLDRLARSVRDLLNILERFGQDDIGFVSLREKHIDTTSAGGRLVLNIMASIAEFERELIAARMAEGRQRAMDNGVKFGPPFKLDAFQKREALARIKAGESQSLIA